jgi:hypothetical protein
VQPRQLTATASDHPGKQTNKRTLRMDLNRLTALVAAALLATACSSTETREASSAPEPVAAVEEAAATDATVAEAAAEEEAPRYSRRRGCPNGYAPTGTRVKRCTTSMIGNDVQTTGGEALRNVGNGTESEMTNRGSGGPPQD